MTCTYTVSICNQLILRGWARLCRNSMHARSSLDAPLDAPDKEPSIISPSRIAFFVGKSPWYLPTGLSAARLRQVVRRGKKTLPLTLEARAPAMLSRTISQVTRKAPPGKAPSAVSSSEARRSVPAHGGGRPNEILWSALLPARHRRLIVQYDEARLCGFSWPKGVGFSAPGVPGMARGLGMPETLHDRRATRHEAKKNTMSSNKLLMYFFSCSRDRVCLSILSLRGYVHRPRVISA